MPTPSIQSSGSLQPPFMEARRIWKTFGPTVAIADVSLQLHSGRVLTLLGDNGAGKSTLIKILCGALQPDRGELRINGNQVVLASPKHARRLGIATVFQDLAVCNLLSITRNVVLGHEPTKGWSFLKWLDVKTADQQTHAALEALGIRFDRGYDQTAGSLSGGERQALAIARAMFYGSGLLILDEPTSALAVRPAMRILQHAKDAAASGQAVLLITHNFAHALSVADDIVVLAHGRVAGSFAAGQVKADELTELVGRVS